MAVTIKEAGGRNPASELAVRVADITMASYTSTGEAVTPAQFQLSAIVHILCEVAPGGWQPHYDASVGKILVRGTGSGNQAAFAEPAAATNVGTFRAIIFGRP